MLLNILKTIVLGSIATVVFFYASDYYLAVSEPKSMMKNVFVYGLQIAFPFIYLSATIAFMIFNRFFRRKIQSERH